MRRARQLGFTLSELMVVLAIIGILTTLAVTYAGEPRANVQGLGNQLVGALDAAKLRAVASQRWQRMSYDEGTHRFVFEQAAAEGMAAPDGTDPEAWAQVELLSVPNSITIHGMTESANVTSGDGVPDAGDGLDVEVWFAPDGSGQARTIYFSSLSGREVARVIVYRITGTATMKEAW